MSKHVTSQMIKNYNLKERAERRGRPIATNNDSEVRTLQQELMDKNKVCILSIFVKDRPQIIISQIVFFCM